METFRAGTDAFIWLLLHIWHLLMSAGEILPSRLFSFNQMEKNLQTQMKKLSINNGLIHQ